MAERVLCCPPLSPYSCRIFTYKGAVASAPWAKKGEELRARGDGDFREQKEPPAPGGGTRPTEDARGPWGYADAYFSHSLSDSGVAGLTM